MSHNKDKNHSVRVLAALQQAYPHATCALHYQNPYQLLVATILSAQCTDKQVNLTTPALFARYPDAEALAQAPVSEIETLVRSTGFYRNKAKNLVAMAQQLTSEHHGHVPRSQAALTALPGVARKTANVVLSVGYQQSEGVVVDTHVMRLSVRLGLAKGKNPVTIEQELMAIVPQAHWMQVSHELIDHGRKICRAQKPQCTACPLAPLCPKIGLL
jgi:endonuclease-3